MILSLFKSTGSLTDAELMQRVSTKDDDRAFDELYRRHARRVMGFFYRQVRRDEERASDLMQDTFMRVWAGRQRWSSDADFLPWLFTIAYNICKNEYRYKDYQSGYEQHVLNTQDEVQEAEVEIALDSRIFDQALRTLLDEMPPDARTLFALRFEEELSVPQIAEVMGIPQGTVKSRIHTLTRTLKEKLKQYGNI